MAKFSNWSRENLEKFAQDATDKMTAEAQEPRRPLTDEEIRALWAQCAPNIGGTLDFARLIERRCGIDTKGAAYTRGFDDPPRYITRCPGVSTDEGELVPPCNRCRRAAPLRSPWYLYPPRVGNDCVMLLEIEPR